MNSKSQLKGMFGKPEKAVSIEAMNKVIAVQGAMAVLKPLHTPPHPGQILREYLTEMSITEAAEKIGVDQFQLSSVLAGSAPITPDLANLLAHALGTSVAIWEGLQRHYDLRFQAKQQP